MTEKTVDCDLKHQHTKKNLMGLIIGSPEPLQLSNKISGDYILFFTRYFRSQDDKQGEQIKRVSRLES